MRRLFCLALIGSAVAIGVGSAGAAPPETLNPGLSHIGGIVLPIQAANNGASRGGGGQALQYHGGPVMHANRVYAIFWQPSGYSLSANYQGLIDQYFTDVQAATSAADPNNVYYTARQYYDGGGNITFSGSTYGGSYLDTAALPNSGCSDSYTSVCLSDSQIQSEIRRVAGLAGWAIDSSSEFFMFTAKGIGSCSGSACAFSYYCAYHGYSGSLLYANMPYADTVPAACDAGYHPNGDDADATINVTSHEHNETITDMNLNAWYDRSGAENGDKCAWKFGSLSGSGSSAYNQTIGGHHYILQLEYSNASRGCVQTGT